MTTDTDKTMHIRITRDQAGTVGSLAATIGYWTGMVAMLLLGMLVVVAVEMATVLEPTRVTFDLLRAATLGGGVVAAFCWFIHYEAGNVVTRLEQQVGQAADRNRNATLDLQHRVDDLRDVVFDSAWKTMSVVQAGTKAAQDHRHAIHEAADRVGGEFAEYRREMADVSAVLAWLCLRLQQTVPDPSGLDAEALGAFRRLNERLSRDGG